MSLSEVSHRHMANAVRALSMDAVERAKSGHPGMPMGMADVATVLFRDYLRFDATDPDWPDRDRFVLSAGHGSMLLYSLLHLTGYPGVTLDELKNFRQIGSLTPGHPEYRHTAGVETTTGPLGQGLSTAVGMTLGERLMAARFGAGIVDHRTFVIASDGDLMEGISHEAAGFAGHMKLGRLIVLWDDNDISIDGSTELSTSEKVGDRFRAYGWHVTSCDGHDPAGIARALDEAISDDGRPSLIACKTTIGYGAPTKAGTAGSHGAPLGGDEIAGARAALDWPSEPFDLPQDVVAAWAAAGNRGASDRKNWEGRLASMDAALRGEWDRVHAHGLPAVGRTALAAVKAGFADEKPGIATRQASGKVLDALVPAMPEMIGGSADLTGSNNTRAGNQKAIAPGDFVGSYVHYGIREHGMAAAMNGMALHGGLIPYGGTFLVFSDYCRPSIRLAALMGIRSIFVLTHDSIGLGEDGPTHQPVEHLAALRAIPNLLVLRPADAIETAEAWEMALSQETRPSVIALTRQGCPSLRHDTAAENLTARGAYRLAGETAGQVVLAATGSEVSLAMEARAALAADGIEASVVSMPSFELFAEQDRAWQDDVLPPGVPVVGVEAAIAQGWDRHIGRDGAFVGMTGFGASGPYKELYEHFGITADAVAAAARSILNGR